MCTLKLVRLAYIEVPIIVNSYPFLWRHNYHALSMDIWFNFFTANEEEEETAGNLPSFLFNSISQT